VGLNGIAPALRDGGRCGLRLSRDFIPGYYRFVPLGRKGTRLHQVRRIGAMRGESTVS
jgi:hypothetical protein